MKIRFQTKGTLFALLELCRNFDTFAELFECYELKRKSMRKVVITDNIVLQAYSFHKVKENSFMNVFPKKIITSQDHGTHIDQVRNFVRKNWEINHFKFLFIDIFSIQRLDFNQVKTVWITLLSKFLCFPKESLIIRCLTLICVLNRATKIVNLFFERL